MATAEAKRHLDLGEDLYRRQEYASAIEEFTIAIRAYPDYDEAYYHRGLAHGDFKRLDEAITDFTTAARLAPQKTEPFYRRGQVYAHLERFAEAVADYTEAIRLTPSNPEVRGRILYDRARAHFLSRSYPAASADCTAMLRLIPGAAEAYLLRGQSTEATGDPKAAIPDFREAKRLDPSMYRAARTEWPTLPENP
ncbi:MAG: tetratricopeptide repeat protein [Planctomycetes bacterium]|nr:tetratricopeptide repeat protein [Planctomycetota bacterium]